MKPRGSCFISPPPVDLPGKDSKSTEMLRSPWQVSNSTVDRLHSSPARGRTHSALEESRSGGQISGGFTERSRGQGSEVWSVFYRTSCCSLRFALQRLCCYDTQLTSFILQDPPAKLTTNTCTRSFTPRRVLFAVRGVHSAPIRKHLTELFEPWVVRVCRPWALGYMIAETEQVVASYL